MQDNKKKVSKNLLQNITAFKQIFSDCADIKMIEMKLGNEQKVS